MFISLRIAVGLITKIFKSLSIIILILFVEVEGVILEIEETVRHVKKVREVKS